MFGCQLQLEGGSSLDVHLLWQCVFYLGRSEAYGHEYGLKMMGTWVVRLETRIVGRHGLGGRDFLSDSYPHLGFCNEVP